MKNSGVLIIDTIRPYDSNDSYPIAIANELKGGYHQVADLTERDAIPIDRRSQGMTCWVISEEKLYRLVSGITNNDWVEVNSTGISNITFIVDGSNIEISDGLKCWIRIPFNGILTGWELTGDLTGSCVIDVLKSSYSDFPTFNSITYTNYLTLTNQLKNQNNNLTGWATNIISGDYLRINIINTTTIKKLIVNLLIYRS